MASTDPRTPAPPRRAPGIIGTVLSTLGFAALLTLGNTAVGPLPALGPLLDPLAGIWSVASQAKAPAAASAVIPSLDGPVEVEFDDRGVPHIHATTELDAIRALGYVQAQDRLFQLELQTRATAGTLTELIGARALPLDREQRRLGLAWSARRALDALPEGSPELALYRALADGINARIDTLGRRERPFEYHVLGRTPQRWQPLHSLLLERRMAYTLSYDDEDLWRQRAIALVGEEAADVLYPTNSPVQEPIQPNGSDSSRLMPFRLPPPTNVNRSLLRRADAQLAAVPAPASAPPGMVLGSNNWAAAGSRTRSGNAILAGDPHLQMTLPSIWYEAHLVVEEEGLDVHGVTIPGLPGVIIGFTPDVAWSVTNNAADVVDYYEETLDDATAPQRYRLDGEWRALQSQEESFFGTDGELLAQYVQHYTHRGPLLMTESDGALSMRWTSLDRGSSPTVFLAAARAKNVDELMDAFAPFSSPAQNFAMADATGRIAIRSTGRYPIRPPENHSGGELDASDGVDGRRLRDGSTSTSDWVGYWPSSRYPQAVDPDQGYVASANQQPVDPAVEDAYLGTGWTSPWRALRINRLFREHPSPLTFEDLQAFQTDPGNEKALRFVEYFVAAADASLAVPAAMLREWDGHYTPEASAPLLFETAYSELRRLLWDELRFESLGDARPRPPWPSGAVVYALAVSEPNSPWWDRLETPSVEGRDDLFRQALGAAWSSLVQAHGDADAGAWAWRRHRRANINHLGRFPGLGRMDLEVVGGGPGNLNPSSGSGTHGASWRMVVELAPEGPVAKVVYPGGQSGNPASRHYADRIALWQRGQLAPVVHAPLGSQGWRRLSLTPGDEPLEAEVTR